MQREVLFRPAYNKIDEGYGRHNMEITFVLKGEHGAISLTMYTGWMTPADQRLFYNKELYFQRYPWGTDLSYHSPIPLYQDQSKIENCKYLDGRECYCDGTSIGADELMDRFLLEGDEVVWKALEEWYEDRLAHNYTFDI